MNVRTSLLGIYAPGDGWLFRMPVGAKYLLMLVLAIGPFVFWTWWATAASIVAAVVIMLTSGIGLRRILDIGAYLWILMAVMAGYQLISALPMLAFVSPGSLLAAVLASRLLTLTTSTPALLDALAVGLGPLRWVRINPEAVALTVALMMRSVPYLAGSVQDVRDAARARGQNRNPVLLLTPAVVSAVAYAQRTGEALQARGLPEEDA